jgi:hypothetical protein
MMALEGLLNGISSLSFLLAFTASIEVIGGPIR